MDVFSLFATTNYTFLQLESGAGGNKVVQETIANGVVKLRDGMTQVDNVESEDSDASVHIRPTEAFLATVGNNTVGHGIRIDGVDYRITAQVDGMDFDLGVLNFYRVILKRERLWVASDLPLV